MQTQLLRTLAALPLAAAGAFLFADSAIAFSITFDDSSSLSSSNSVSITDNGTGDTNSNSGEIQASGLSVGSFDVSFTGATSSSPNPANPSLDLTTFNATGSGDLFFEVTDDGFTPQANSFITGLSSSKLAGDLELTAFVDGQALTTISLDGPITGSDSVKVSDLFPAGAGDPYTLTLLGKLTHSPSGGTSSFEGSVAPVPEPFTVMGSLVALGFGVYSKRKFKVSTENQNS